jgi:hypothetical protein
VVMVIDSRTSNKACKDIIGLDQGSFAFVVEGGCNQVCCLQCVSHLVIFCML